MIQTRTLRFRMMVLFCSLVGVLLAVSYLAFWGLLVHEVSAQVNRQLLETARPIVADIGSEPNAKDVNRLDISGEYFELLDSSGRVLQHSLNLSAPIDLKGMNPAATSPSFGIATIGNQEAVHLALIPFQRPGEARVLAVAIPALSTSRAIGSFERIAILVFPMSLILTAAISAIYVGKSLIPVIELTRHAELMAKRVTNRDGFWTPLPVSSPRDELGRLAETINHLLRSVDSAVRQLRQFVTDASHELRTPLTVLHGEAELFLSRQRTATEYRATMQVFDDEIAKLARIVEALFTLSMADAGQLRLASELVYIDELLEDACTLVTLRAGTKDISLARNLQPEVEYLGDEAFLHQLFLIFLDNAIKYSPSHTRIDVTLERRDGNIRVSFADQGIGISPEHLPFIFDRFFRAASLGVGDTHSGGLGLAIAQAIVTALGGCIECASTPGAGSTFTVVLPSQYQALSDTVIQDKQKLILD
ncbi:MAG: sensor histidine kinase [Candidatus Acidiferrales bacterium]